MTHFAKPNFIVYDLWFDEKLGKAKHDDESKVVNKILNIHNFNMNNPIKKLVLRKQLEISYKNKKELLSHDCIENTSQKN